MEAGVIEKCLAIWPAFRSDFFRRVRMRRRVGSARAFQVVFIFRYLGEYLNDSGWWGGVKGYKKTTFWGGNFVNLVWFYTHTLNR